MNKYLLLRDNKQSGPFTVAEIIAKGIKAYDLVWLEGKSAAWRYPSEIEELKPYAPVVEEQPYDRFYKKSDQGQNKNMPVDLKENALSDLKENTRVVNLNKNIAVNLNHNIVADLNKEIVADLNTNSLVAGQHGNIHKETTRPDAIKTNDVITEKGIAEKDHSAYQPKPRDVQPQKIYINFPGSRIPASAPNEKEKTIAVSTAYPIPEPLPENVNERLRNEPSAVDWNSSSPGWNSSSGSWNTSSSIRNELAAPGQKNGFFFRSYITWIIASCLVLAGVLIGLIISNIGQHKNKHDLDIIIKQIQEREKQKIQPATVHTAWTGNADNEPVAGNDQQRSTAGIIPAAGDRPKNNLLDKPVAAIASDPLPAKNVKAAPAKAVAHGHQNNRPSDIQQPEAAILNAAAEESSGAASNILPPNAAGRENLYKLVSVKASKYKTGVLGGISALQLEITNSSPYTLQQVEVQVNYLGLEKKLIRSQNVYFKNIAPGEHLVQEVPKSSRGVYVEYLISRID